MYKLFNIDIHLKLLLEYRRYQFRQSDQAKKIACEKYPFKFIALYDTLNLNELPERFIWYGHLADSSNVLINVTTAKYLKENNFRPTRTIRTEGGPFSYLVETEFENESKKDTLITMREERTLGLTSQQNTSIDTTSYLTFWMHSLHYEGKVITTELKDSCLYALLKVTNNHSQYYERSPFVIAKLSETGFYNKWVYIEPYPYYEKILNQNLMKLFLSERKKFIPNASVVFPLKK
jgi:hypothetical protein